jgi:hypothetical protein
MIIPTIIFLGSLVYGIFMIIYLTNAKKCDASMEKRDVDFRKTALILSWISVMLYSLVLILGIVFGLVDLKYKLSQ